MNGKHFQGSRKAPNTVSTRGLIRPKSTLSSNSLSNSNRPAIKKQEEVPVLNVPSIYSDVVDIIMSNTDCDRKCAEKTFSEIAQLVNATVACKLKDAATGEVVSKLFHVKVDPVKNLLSSLSFALTTVVNGGQAEEDLEEGREVNGDGNRNSARKNVYVYEEAKSIDELVDLMQKNWDDILKCISRAASQSSVLPLIDYLSLYVTSLADSNHTTNKQVVSSSTTSVPEVESTLETIIGFILDIVMSCDNACAHLVHNVSLFQIALQQRLSSCKTWSVLVTLMLVQGAAQLSANVSKEQCNLVLCDVIASESAPDVIIPLVLALNLGFTYPSQNTLLSAFVSCNSHEVTDFFLSELIALFNRNIDPLSNYYKAVRPKAEVNSVLKLMIDIFSSKAALKKIYTNDQRVILDVILTAMNDLSPGSQARVDMMSLLDLAVKNVAMMREEPKYKLAEFLAVVQPISEQIDCLEEALIARSILSNLND